MTPGQHELCRSLFRVSGRILPAPRPRDCILCYHSLRPGNNGRFCPPEQFETHLRWLSANCNIVPLHRLLDPGRRRSRESKPWVAITFDDGHADNYEHALPLLLKLGAPATFFLAVGYLDRDPAVMRRFEFFARSQLKPEPLSWQQAREMARSGMRVEAHTYSHANLAFLSAAELEFEIRGCKRLLEDRIGQAVEGFAYPFGMPRCHFDRRARDLAQEAGYSYALTTVHRGLRATDCRYLLPRLTIRADDLPTFVDKVSGAWDLLGRFNERAPRWMGSLVSPRGFRESTYG